MATEPVAAPVTQPHVVLVVIYSLALLSLLGLVGTFVLVREKIDGASIAVFSGLTGTVVGGLMSALNNTRTAAVPAAPEPALNPVSLSRV